MGNGSQILDANELKDPTISCKNCSNEHQCNLLNLIKLFKYQSLFNPEENLDEKA